MVGLRKDAKNALRRTNVKKINFAKIIAKKLVNYVTNSMLFAKIEFEE